MEFKYKIESLRILWFDEQSQRQNFIRNLSLRLIEFNCKWDIFGEILIEKKPDHMHPLPQHAHHGILPPLCECDVIEIFRFCCCDVDR